MSNIVDVYTDAVHQHLAPLYANWEPGASVQLGTIGEMRGARFVPEGHLDDYEIHVESRKGKILHHLTFATDKSTRVDVESGSRTIGTTGSGFVNIQLGSADSVFFSAAGCKHHTIAHKPALANAIMHRYREGSWQRHWVLVTDLIEVDSATIAVAGGGNAGLRLQARCDTGCVELANASLKLSVSSERSIAYKFVAHSGSLLLLGLSKIQRRWWIGDVSLRTMNLLEPDVDEGVAEEEDLFFGQLQ